MKSLTAIIAIIETLDTEAYAALYDSDEALTAVGLTREEFDAYCRAEDATGEGEGWEWEDPWDE